MLAQLYSKNKTCSKRHSNMLLSHALSSWLPFSFLQTSSKERVCAGAFLPPPNLGMKTAAPPANSLFPWLQRSECTHRAAVDGCMVFSTAPVSKEFLTLLAVKSNYWSQKIQSWKKDGVTFKCKQRKRRTLVRKRRRLIVLPLCFINFWSSFISTSIWLAVARFNRLLGSLSSVWKTSAKWRIA